MTAGAPPTGPRFRVLAVDDEPALLSALRRILKLSGWDTEITTDAREALARLETEHADFDVLLSDIMMAPMSGLELLDKTRVLYPDLPVVLMTADQSARTAVRALKAGAYDYLVKPFDEPDAVVHALTRAVEHRRLVVRTRELERQVDVSQRFEQLIGSSPKIRAVFDVVSRVAGTDVTVLVRGESGTGKELIARAIHARSTRARGAFVAVNCAALPEGLLESELFGHVRGAFSGAVGERRGVFEEADHGTLFLDEIGDISQQTQVRLLRALQEREIKPVGGNVARKVDVRVIAATHVDLEAAVRAKKFREDLFYRLNVVSIELPPLRDRLDDVPLLAAHFVRKHAARQKRQAPTVTADAVHALISYPWPGNVRELENAIERALALGTGPTLDAALLPGPARRSASDAGLDGGDPDDGGLDDIPFNDARIIAQRNFERRYLERLLKRTAGNISEAARLAGLDRSNFRRILARNNLKTPDE